MTTIRDFHEAIQAALLAKFGDDVNTVCWYQQAESSTGQPLPIETPAIILEIESAEEGDDVGDDRIPMLCHITGYCILSQKTTDLQIELRNFASQLLGEVRKNKWSLGNDVSFPFSVTLGPGKFNPEVQGYDSWFVSWAQTLYIGESVWKPTGIIPTEIWWSWAPDIGIPHVDDYQLDEG